MQLHEVPHVKLNADFEIRRITERDLNNYLRMFKSSEETLRFDCVYSPFFDSDPFYVIGDDYAGRMELLQTLKSYFPDEYISFRLTYDFSNAPVELRYSTKAEFRYIGNILDKSTEGTNLSLVLFVSHFRQFESKTSKTMKPEHFHGLLKAKSNVNYEVETLKYVDILSKHPLFQIKTIKSSIR